MSGFEDLLSSSSTSKFASYKSLRSKPTLSKRNMKDINEVMQLAREFNFAVEAESTNGRISSLYAEFIGNHFKIRINYRIKANKPLVDLNINAKNLTAREIEDFGVIVKDAIQLAKKLRGVEP